MDSRTSTLARFFPLLLMVHSIALASVWEINVNTVMTAAGRKLPHPTSAQPAFYLPYVVGYQEIGSVSASAKKLSADVPIEHYLATALASQGYLVTHVTGTKLDPPPSLLLIFRWGHLNSHIYDDQDEDTGATNHHYNERAHQKAMLLVGVKETDLFDDRMTKRDLVSSADDERYYVTIAAYDFATYYTQHKTDLLWVSRMSIPQQDLELDQVVAPLITTGTPFLGRETVDPQVIDIGGPTGKVEVGPTVVKGTVTPDAAQPPAPTPAPQH